MRAHWPHSPLGSSMAVWLAVSACSRTGLWIDDAPPAIASAGNNSGGTGELSEQGGSFAATSSSAIIGKGGTLGYGGASIGTVGLPTTGGTVSSGGSLSRGGSVSSGGSLSRGGSVSRTVGGTSARASSAAGGSIANCVPTRQSIAVHPTRVFVVVDASSSMSRRPSGSSRTSWDVTIAALTATLDGTTANGFDAATELGLLTYPNTVIDTVLRLDPGPLDRCVNVDAAVSPATLGAAASTQRTRLMSAIEETTLDHGTPTYDAYEVGLTDLLRDSTAADLSRSYLLLITDGSPTLSGGCVNPNSGTFRNVDAQPIVTEIGAAYTRGIRTFVVGLPGSQSSRTWLSEAAQRGGTARPGCATSGSGNYCHLDVSTAPDFETALRNALTTVVADVSPCRFAFSAPLPTSGVASVAVIGNDGTSTELNRVTANGAGCHDGFWILEDQGLNGPMIELCADSCAWAYHRPESTLVIDSGCSVP